MAQNKTPKPARKEANGSMRGDFGLYSSLFSAKSNIEGQDGGVVTSLLAEGFKLGMFDAAIVVRRIHGYNAQVTVATDANGVLAAKGTTYVRVNMAMTLRELIKQGKKHIAVVCTPCQAKLARRIQQTCNNREITIIGLFCFEAFNPARLKAEVKARLGVDLDEAQKTQVREGKFSVQVQGKEYSCKVKDLADASEECCRFCGDFTSEAADISVGSVGSKPGNSTVIVRSKLGEKMVKAINAQMDTVDEAEIARLARFKRGRADKNFAAAKNQPTA